MKALVIDDDAFLRQLMKLNLEKFGFTVETSVNGAEAYYLLQRFDFNVVISDINMPLMSGVQLYRLVADRLPHLKDRFIFCTGNADDHEFFFKESNRPVLPKPYTSIELAAAIKKIQEVCT